MSSSMLTERVGPVEHQQRRREGIMSAAEVFEQLKYLSNAERLAVIEAASRLIRADLASPPAHSAEEQERRIQAAAMAVRDLYEPGGELTEWTNLDAEEVLDDYVQG